MFRKSTLAIGLALATAIAVAPAANSVVPTPNAGIATVTKSKASGIASLADIIKLNINITVQGEKKLKVTTAANKKTVKKGASVEAGSRFDASQKLLGIDLPYHMYTQFGFPYDYFEKPKLQYSTADLNSLDFTKKYNTVAKKNHWMVWGRSNKLSGTERLEIKGSAKAKKAGFGHIIGGTNTISGIPTSGYTHRNTVLGITVK